MSRALVVVMVLLCTVSGVRAQQIGGSPRNALYLEMLGNAGLFSVNYDRRVAGQGIVRAGLAAWTSEDFWSDDAETRIRSGLVMVGTTRGQHRNRFELGVGLLAGRKTDVYIGQTSNTTSFVTLTGTLGYRRQPEGRGFLFRAGITPFYGFGNEDDAYPDKGLFPSVGLSVGYSF